MTSTITLITDFGLMDEYVGVMKGAILCRCPQVTIVDISHQVPPQNIAAGARMLDASYRHFPPQSIHVVVIDPGVGTERGIIVARGDDHLFIGPDNGVLSPILKKEETSCYSLTPSFYPQETSATFHGRDIMGPLAGELATDHHNLSAYSTPIKRSECVIIEPYQKVFTDKGVQGEVTGIDHFGNITASIRGEDLQKIAPPLSISLAGKTIQGLSRTYSDVGPGETLALIGSRGFLEIGVNLGNCAEELRVELGTAIQITGSNIRTVIPVK